MLKLTHVSGAMAALMAVTVLSGCGGGSGSGPVGLPTTTGSDAHTTQAQTPDAQPTLNPVAKARAAAQVATVQAATAAKAKARAKANPADPAAAQAAERADAAVAYWRIITRFNVANAAFGKLSDVRTSQPAIPASFRAAARTFSMAHAREAAELRAYDAWPPSVKPWMDKFIAHKEILAGYHLKMAAAPGWDAWDKGNQQSKLRSAETARLSALIRRGLGLPPPLG
jgi:hypothetical protein